MTADVLEERYGLVVDVVEPVHMGTDTINRRVLTDDGIRLFVKEYRSTADLVAARTAWDMSEYCRAARLPIPRVWDDEDGNLITIAQSSAWAVVDEAPGRVTPAAMTVPLAQHICSAGPGLRKPQRTGHARAAATYMQALAEVLDKAEGVLRSLLGAAGRKLGVSAISRS